MLNSLKIIYKSFYDKSFVKEYINNGKGEGIIALGIVALITSLIIMTSLTVLIKTNINKESIDIIMSDFKRNVPTVAIDNGNLVWEDNVINDFYLANNTIKLTVDTKSQEIGINQIKDSKVYITRTHVYINNENEIKSFELANISDLSEDKYIDITSDENLGIVADLILKAINIMLAVVFVLLFLVSWIVNTFLCKMTRFFAKIAFKDLKTLKYDVLERAVTASIIPAILLLDSITSFTGTPNWIVRWIVIIAFGVFVAKKHLSEPTVEA